MYFGEALPFGARDHIEGKLGIPVFSRYSAAECFKIGFFCKERAGFHIHEDLCHVRIKDSQGQDVPPGVQGEVVISNLINRAHVLLNVPLGDLATFNDEPCACGQTFRRISELEGRTEDILVLGNSGYLHIYADSPGVSDEIEDLEGDISMIELSFWIALILGIIAFA